MIVSPNPSKAAPDFRFVVMENSNTEPIQFEMVYNQYPPRLRSVGKINTICDMHDMMSKSLEIMAPCRTENNLINAITPVYSISGFSIDRSIQEKGIFFSPDFPEFLLPKNRPTEYKASPLTIQNAITWGVVRQEPGTVSQDDPFRGTRELKGRHREFIAYYGSEGRKRLIGVSETLIRDISEKYGYMKMKAQVFDNLVQYNIWSKSNYEAERLTEWFLEEYMDNYIGMFREAGIVNMYFDRRVRDNTLLEMKNNYHVRSVLYYIRTERVRPIFIGPIKQITLNINVQNLQEPIVSTDFNIESQYDKLIKKWIQRNQLGG